MKRSHRPMRSGHVISLAAIFLHLAILYCLPQEKPRPRPRPARIHPAEDSLRTTTATPRKSTAKTGERLELPDVMVYGRDTATRLPDSKLAPAAEAISLQRMEIARSLPDTAILLTGRKDLHLIKSETRHRQFSTHAAGGEFGQFETSLRFDHSTDGTEVRGAADYGRSSGQFENTQMQQLALAGQVGTAISTRLSGSAQGLFRTRKFGLHGAVLSDYERTADRFKLAASSRLQVNEASQLDIAADYFLGVVRDRATPDSATFEAGLDWRTYSLGASWEGRFSKLIATVRFSLLNDELDYTFATMSNNRYSVLQGELLFPVNPQLNLALGLRLSNHRSEQTERHSRFSPLLRALWFPRSNLVFSGEISGGLRYAPLRTRLEQNPYLDPDNRMEADDNQWQLQLATEIRVSKGWFIKARYRHEVMKQWGYWQSSDSTGLFRLHYLPEVSLTELRLGLGGRLGTSLRLNAAIRLLGDRQGNASPSLTAKLPYRSEFWLPISLTYEPSATVRATCEVNWVGGRHTSLDSDNKLGAYAEVNLSGDWQITRVIALVAEARNLLDTDYQLWQGFPEMGLNFIAGIRAGW